MTGCATARMKDLTPSYLMNPPSSFSSTPITYTSISAIPEDQHHVLVSADSNGTILIRVWGNVCLARLDTNRTDIRAIYMPHNDASSVLVATTNGDLLHYTFDMCPEELLFVVGHHIREIQGQWATITSALKQLQTEWDNGVRLFEAKFRLLRGEYAKYGCKQVPQMHLYTLLCSGLCYPALELFLSQYLQEQSILKMQKTFAHGCHAVDGLLHDHLAPSAATILFRLSELRGLGRFHALSFKHIGLDMAVLSNVMESMESLALDLSAMQRAVRETAVDFGLFLDWVGDMSAFVTNKTATGSRNPIDTQRLGCFLNRAYHVAIASRQKDPTGDIELTFGNPVPQGIASLVREKERIHRQWTALLDQEAASTRSTPLAISKRLALLSPPKTVVFGPQFTVAFGNQSPVVVLDTATWVALATPPTAPSFQVVQASMYVREAAAPRVAVVVSDGYQAYLQLLPVETTAMGSSPSRAQEHECIRSRALIGWSTVVSLVANGTRGVLCLLSHQHSTFVMYDGECDDSEVDDE
ncbi:hypothetical protein, variant [Aphanomyces invadans]|nr:hypothetical protein, variant [Aphanomyces invadans]ETV97945.1 hypothetical protein, variant [Aphanomyces invadans]|eukprot:XP_008873506.1 hypothetical protein, variant [Aphanomyces invadans]